MLVTLNMKLSSIALLVAVFLCGPVAFSAEAQQAVRVPRVGFLQPTQNENATAFIQALRDAGYIDGQTVRLEARFYAAHVDKLPALVSELTRRWRRPGKRSRGERVGQESEPSRRQPYRTVPRPS